MIEPMKAKWVIGRYAHNTPQGKTVLALQGEGVGYVLMNPTRGKTDDAIVAFRRAEDIPLPPHLTYATTTQSLMLEAKRSPKSGRT